MKVFVTVDSDGSVMVFASKVTLLKAFREANEAETAALSDEEAFGVLRGSVNVHECEVIGGLTLRERGG